MKEHFIKLSCLLLCLLASAMACGASSSQPTFIDQFEVKGVPEIPAELAESLSHYHNTRSSLFIGFTPNGKNVYIKTRFEGMNQIHEVSRPGGSQTQLTWAKEPIGESVRQPGGELIAYAMDTGGSGFDQIYLLEPSSGETRLLTDGESLNNRMVWDRSGKRLAYRSTRRNGHNNDIWVMDIDQPENARILLEADNGALWKPVEFSDDGQKLLVQY